MVVAIVAVQPDAEPLAFAEMQAFLKEQGLRMQALPERLEHLEEIPRNASGKVVKNDLRDRYSELTRRRLAPDRQTHPTAGGRRRQRLCGARPGEA